MKYQKYTSIFFSILLGLGLIFSNTTVFAGGGGHGDDHHGEENFNLKDMIMHHIADANEFHILGDFSLPLPCIIYTPENGVDFFMSSVFDHGHKNHKSGAVEYTLHHSRVQRVDEGSMIDFSITKNVFTMLLAALLLIFLFTRVARAYTTRKGQAPTGLQNFVEPLFIFIQDEVIKANIPHKWEKYLPYLMTIFFFIFICNLFGLVPFFPGSANVSGNIAFTLTLAIFTFLVTNLSGNGHYWQHIVWMPGIPTFVKPILSVVEIAGLFIKPFSLMIRLFANITGGHILILSLIGLIFVFGEMGKNMLGVGAGVGLSFPFVMFINCIELLVAFLQAFIFTILSALYIGMAVEEAHDH